MKYESHANHGGLSQESGLWRLSKAVVTCDATTAPRHFVRAERITCADEDGALHIYTYMSQQTQNPHVQMTTVLCDQKNPDYTHIIIGQHECMERAFENNLIFWLHLSLVNMQKICIGNVDSVHVSARNVMP
jgi:hypothetical protein